MKSLGSPVIHTTDKDFVLTSATGQVMVRLVWDHSGLFYVMGDKIAGRLIADHQDAQRLHKWLTQRFIEQRRLK